MMTKIEEKKVIQSLKMIILYFNFFLFFLSLVHSRSLFEVVESKGLKKGGSKKLMCEAGLLSCNARII